MTQQLVTENDMSKIFISLILIFLAGDPGMETLYWLGDMKTYVVAAAITLCSMPFIASQFDG